MPLIALLETGSLRPSYLVLFMGVSRNRISRDACNLERQCQTYANDPEILLLFYIPRVYIFGFFQKCRINTKCSAGKKQFNCSTLTDQHGGGFRSELDFYLAVWLQGLMESFSPASVFFSWLSQWF